MSVFVLFPFLLTSLCVLYQRADASIPNEWRESHLDTPAVEKRFDSSFRNYNVRQKRSQTLEYTDGLFVTLKSAKREPLPNEEGARFTVVFERNVQEAVQVFWTDDYRGRRTWIHADVEIVDGGLEQVTVNSLWTNQSQSYNQIYFFFTSTHADNDLLIQLVDHLRGYRPPETDIVEEQLNLPDVSLSPLADAVYEPDQDLDVFVRTAIPTVDARTFLLDQNQMTVSRASGWQNEHLEVQKLNESSDNVATFRVRLQTHGQNVTGVLEVEAILDQRFFSEIVLLKTAIIRKVKKIIQSGSPTSEPFPEGFAQFVRGDGFGSFKKCYTDSSAPSMFPCTITCQAVGDEIGEINLFQHTPEGTWDAVAPMAPSLPEIDNPIYSRLPGTWYKAKIFRIDIPDDLLGQEILVRCETRNGTGGLDTLQINIDVESNHF